MGRNVSLNPIREYICYGTTPIYLFNIIMKFINDIISKQVRKIAKANSEGKKMENSFPDYIIIIQKWLVYNFTLSSSDRCHLFLNFIPATNSRNRRHNHIVLFSLPFEFIAVHPFTHQPHHILIYTLNMSSWLVLYMSGCFLALDNRKIDKMLRGLVEKYYYYCSRRIMFWWINQCVVILVEWNILVTCPRG